MSKFFAGGGEMMEWKTALTFMRGNNLLKRKFSNCWITQSMIKRTQVPRKKLTFSTHDSNQWDSNQKQFAQFQPKS